MKNLFLKILKFLFKIDVRELLRQNVKFKTENQKLSEELQNSIEEIYNQNVEINSITNRDIDLTKKLENLLSSKKLVEKEYNQIQNSIEKLQLENQNLLKRIQDEEKEILSLKEQIKKTEEKYSTKDETIEELKITIEENKKTSQKQNQELGSLKELISSYQTDSKNTIEKDNLIKKLRDNINQVTYEKKSLIDEFEHHKEETKKIQHSRDSKSIQKLPDGSLVEHENLILGERTISNQEEEKNRFEYIGHFLFDLHVYYQSDNLKFPAAFYPKKGTNILKWHNSSLTETKGVSEPKLVKGLQQLDRICPEIEILQNIVLSIKNREYGYRPDIALFWKKYNLCIDIEIDEPYDILSRKPIHFIDSSDYLRNLYFIRQGWVVLRFSEEQVINNTEYCVKYIANILKKITEEEIFHSLLEDFQVEESDRWTYNQALEFAQNNHRESYLEIETPDLTTLPDISNSEFKGIAPREDILPEIDFSGLKQKFENSKQKKYVRITRLPYEIQYILQNAEIETQKFADGISGFDLVAEKNTFIPFEVVMEIEGLDSPFKYPLYHNTQGHEDEKLYDLVKEAIYECNPIRMEYRDGKADITFRNLTNISFNGDSVEYLCDRMWKNYYSPKGSMIQAFCMLRKDLRNFYINRILSIQIFNLHDFGIGHLLTFGAALWYPLEKNDLKLSKIIANLTPKHEKENNLIAAGNFAHYLLVSGEVEKALDIYRKFDGKLVNEKITWRNMNLKDFEDLKDIADYGERFENAIHLLGWN
ncbi:MAG: hypothetical protein RBR97_16715 [Bacteroidales bacterium]|jgi:hypothetical protein|nr:hypothetical protein [Bacteroidales bacterium]